MTVHYPDQRVGVFVDIGNMYHSAKNLYSAKLNFGKILELAKNNRRLVRALCYAIVSQTNEEKSFFEALHNQGYEVKTKDLQIFPGGAKKGDWDVGLAIDAITIAGHLDVVVLVTGDGDFVPLISYLRNNAGCRVEVIAFEQSASARLIEASDEFTNISENPKKYLMKDKFR
ncbi:MAG: NYN domain-containing protein [Candidatus Komeilibacteria bacterium]|nr:NYN domain-containing protein [Candidatus Komeilibacteria bacterium]